MMDCGSTNHMEWVSLKPGVPVHVMKFGQPSPEATSTCPSKDDNLMFLVIPGNPGVIEYYEKFMETLYLANDKRIPVWGISHTGHVSTKHVDGSMKELKGQLINETSLEQQVQHKLLFIKTHIPCHTRLILVGHSIGCFIALRLLPYIDERSHHNFFLFPTIERLSSSFAGRIISTFSTFFFLIRWFLLTLVFLLSFVSSRIQSGIIRAYFGRSVIDECALRATMSIFDTSCVQCSFTLGEEELKVVNELDKDLVQKYIDRISFYYGLNDHWCPIEFGYNMKRLFPMADVRFCQDQIEHAFVLRFSRIMATIVSEWFRTIQNSMAERMLIQNSDVKLNKLRSRSSNNGTLKDEEKKGEIFGDETRYLKMNHNDSS